MELTREVVEALGAPFPDDEVEFLPRGFSNGKARALAYIDARSVMRRLDAVVGPENWSFDFDVLSSDGKQVKGRLTVCGVTKCDAGEASDEDEALKSAVSDALKRCAVHFGIGRYLYYLPAVWAPYDSQKRRFSEPPRLAPATIQHALTICGVTAPRATGGEARSRSRDEVAESNGDRAAARASGPAASGRPAAPAHRAAPEPAPAGADPEESRPTPAAGAMVCSQGECGKPLTKGQHDVSVRAFGKPLCPACQKQQARLAA